jgi:hydroxyacylglutathione hydrolase
MKIKRMVVGPIQTNCYLVENEETKHGVLIDPGTTETASWTW